MANNIKPTAQEDLDDLLRQQLSDHAAEQGNGRHIDLDDAVRTWRQRHADAMSQD